MRWSLILFALAGCYSESEFIPSKTTAYCELLLECSDPAVLAFDGITAETCEGTWGPMFQEEASGCKFRRRSAKACIESLALATCPEEGPVELPVVCGAAFDQCPLRIPTQEELEPDPEVESDTDEEPAE